MTGMALRLPDADNDEELRLHLRSLGRLKVLHEFGHLSEEEFSMRKSSIIDSLTNTSSGPSSYQSTLTTLSLPTRKQSCSGSQAILSIPSHKSPSQSGSASGSGSGSASQSGSRLHHRLVHRASSAQSISIPHSHRPHKIKKRCRVRYHPPPRWESVRSEIAVKFCYDYEADKWSKEKIVIKIDTEPFDRGGLRDVFHLHKCSDPDTQWVAKRSQDARDNIVRDIYFRDVRMQAIARHFCHGPNGYNSYKPPKIVDFLEAFVLQLVQRHGSPLCHVEEYIRGEYRKYNNNAGWVSQDDERNTPQAFAHFTIEASKHKLLVCDIQGVGDVYTDPQVHTIEGRGDFGRGNQGEKGFTDFIRTHRCNHICQFLRLTNFNKLPPPDSGTIPVETAMVMQYVQTVHVDFSKSPTKPLLELEGSELPGFIETRKEGTRCWCCIL